MSVLFRLVVGAGAAAVLAGAHGASAGAAASGDALAVRAAVGWETWWRRDAAPSHWTEDAPLAGRVRWRLARPGVEWGELQIRGASEAWRTRVVLVRLDPARVDLALDPAFTRQTTWSVGDAAADAAVALDAGQFRGSLPWGWVLTGGREVLRPQYAPLAGAVVVEQSGRVRVVAPDSVAAVRAGGGVREAFQSYPMLLQNGAVPEPLHAPGLGVSLDHRDARLALGTLADGRVIIALTRFDALGEGLGRIPFGLTSPEMAAVMGALGCRQALLLDGGISGQLLVRDGDGTRTWSGTRRVPLGLVARARP
jgi:Phosphodiester glycosidase